MDDLKRKVNNIYNTNEYDEETNIGILNKPKSKKIISPTIDVVKQIHPEIAKASNDDFLLKNEDNKINGETKISNENNTFLGQEFINDNNLVSGQDDFIREDIRNKKKAKKINSKNIPEKGNLNRELIGLFTSLLIIYLLFRFVFISIKVDGSSMEPTFDNGESGLMFRTNLINHPQLFDVVVFNGENNYQENFLIIKRIMGMPHDTVEIKNNEVYINYKKVDDSWRNSNTILEDLPTFTVPEDHYFVLGDNRNNSRDSRSVGFISKDDIIAAGGIIFWPFDKIKFFS